MNAFFNKIIQWVDKQTHDVFKGGIKVLNFKLTKILKYFLFFILSLIYFPIFLLIRIISNVYLIRFGFLPSSRIGDFANDVNLYLCTKEKTTFQIDLFYLKKPVCNNFLLKVYKRYLFILPEFMINPFILLNKIKFIGNEKHIVKLTKYHNSFDLRNRDEDDKRIDYFNSEDLKIGQSYLESLGIKKNDKYVCLLCRDPSYVKEMFENTYSSEYLRDGDNSTFRYMDIENFRQASEYLLDLGYYVIRLGESNSKQLLINNNKYIDYASSGRKTPFLDIYLSSNCEIFLSSGAGIDIMAAIFNRPIVFASYTTIAHARSVNKKQLQIFKNLKNIKTGKNLTLSEIFDLNLAGAEKTNLFQEKKIELIQNNAQEIQEAVEDMLELIRNNFEISEEKKYYHDKFWSLFEKKIDKYGFKFAHSKLFKAHIGYKFLKNNKNFLE